MSRESSTTSTWGLVSSLIMKVNWSGRHVGANRPVAKYAGRMLTVQFETIPFCSAIVPRRTKRILPRAFKEGSHDAVEEHQDRPAHRRRRSRRRHRPRNGAYGWASTA